MRRHGFIRKRWESVVYARRRAGPALLRIVRAVGTEECAALRRHLGAGFAPVQGLRGIPVAPVALCRSTQPAGTRTGHRYPIANRSWNRTAARCWNARWRRSNASCQPTSYRMRTSPTPVLKITPLANAVPEGCRHTDAPGSGLLPHLKITELLLEVDDWTRLHPTLHPHQERRRRLTTDICC